MSVNQPERDVASAAKERSLVTAALDHEITRRSDVMLAMNALCDRLGRYLARWIGGDGWQALLRRALAETQAPGEPVVLSLGAGAELRWRDDTHLVAARDACVRLLVSVIRMLGRLIGSELALRLVEQGFTAAEVPSGGSDHG